MKISGECRSLSPSGCTRGPGASESDDALRLCLHCRDPQYAAGAAQRFLLGSGRTLGSSSSRCHGAAGADTSPPAASPHELLEWVRCSGGQVSDQLSVEAYGGADGGSGYGLGAREALPAGARLLFLPTPCHLTYDNSSDPALLRLIDGVPAELWGAKLALQLLAQRSAGAGSPFSEYIRNLPVGFQVWHAFRWAGGLGDCVWGWQ